MNKTQAINKARLEVANHLPTLAKLIAEYNATAIIYADRGNGCSYGEYGQQISYGENVARIYGRLRMHRLEQPVRSDDGIECRWASDWKDTKKDGAYGGANDYQFRILF